MIVDAHCHVTEAGPGAPERLEAAMADAGVDRSVLVPGGMLDVGDLTGHLTGRAAPEPLPVRNDVPRACSARAPGRFLAFHCANPLEGPAALEAFERAAAEGAVGLKLAPLVHRFALTARAVKELAALAGHLGLPVYTHVAWWPGASTDKAAALAREFPRTVVILGHMGLGPADREAVEAARALDNLVLETSVASSMIVGTALERLGASKLVFGSEFPLSHPVVELAKLRLLATDTALEQITGGTLRALLPPRARW